MAPIFTRSDIITSPTPPTSLIAAFGPEFAALGALSVPVDLLSTLHKHYPLHGLHAHLGSLRLAFSASNTWPEGFTDADKDVAANKTIADECSQELWPMAVPEAKQTEDEAGLKLLLSIISELEKTTAAAAAAASGADGDDDLEDADDPATLSEALAKALDIAVKLGCDGKAELDERSKGFLGKIAKRLGEPEQIEALTKSARVWPFLLKGALAKEIGVKEAKLKDLGDEVTQAVKEWFEKGPQPSEASKKGLKELLDICDVKTREVWPDELEDVHPKPATLFAKKGASASDIEKLEAKLSVKLPKDYKEFLGITDGFGRILADDVFEAPFYPTREVELKEASEAAKVGDDEDDDEDGIDELDDIEDEDEADGPPAKKMKMMDGNKLLAIAKEAEKKRNGGSSGATAPAAAAASADDEDEDMDDDEEDEALEAALGAYDFSNLKAELLALPDLMFEAYVDEAGDSAAELPDMGQVVVIGGDSGNSFWLLPPDQVRAARDAYLAMYEKVDEGQKTVLRWAMIGFAGSEEAFRSYDDWAFVGWAGGDMAEMHIWTSFRRYVEDMAENSEKVAKDAAEEDAEGEDGDDEDGCFAYRLR